MTGALLRARRRFERLFKPWLPAFGQLYWLLDFQTGPFDAAWLHADEANARRVEALRVDLPAFRNSSASLWRPGLFPSLAPQLRFDEWSYLTGFAATGAEIEAIAGEFARVQPLARAYFDLVERHAATYIIYVDDGWCEVYPTRRDWLEEMLALRGAERIDSSKWRETG